MYSPCANGQQHNSNTKPGQLLYRGIVEIWMLDGCMGLCTLAPGDEQITESVRLVLEAAKNALIRTSTGQVPGTLWIATGSHPTTLRVNKRTGAKSWSQDPDGLHLTLRTFKQDPNLGYHGDEAWHLYHSPPVGTQALEPNTGVVKVTRGRGPPKPVPLRGYGRPCGTPLNSTSTFT